MKTKLGLLVLSALILNACSTEVEKEKEFNTGTAILGLAIPVQLEKDSTRIYLTDFFKDSELVDSIYFMGDMGYSYRADSGIVLVEEYRSTRPMEVLAVVYEGITYHIPVIKSNKTDFRFTYEASSSKVSSVSLKGNFNGWNPKASPLYREDETWQTNIVLAPGVYEYLVVEDGMEMLDGNNPNKKDNGQGGFNSTFTVGAVTPAPSISTYGILGDSIVLNYSEVLSDPIILWQNHIVSRENFRRTGDRLSLALPKWDFDGKSYLRVYGYDEEQLSNDLLIPLIASKPILKADKLERKEKHRYTMYFMMVDRFLNADTTNDFPVNDPEILPPANYYGGDIAGVNAKIEDGYLKSLGMNTVWLSPITQNPTTAYGLWDKGGVRSKFSGYHGYWPISSSKVDFRFGDEEALKELISSAHSQDLNVILDYVANHVHQEHPVYVNNPDWATDLYLPDGTLNTERWDEYRLTTWFDTFMPSLDLSNPEVIEAMTDSALFWFENYPIDGFRHDATKHIPLEFWRALTYKLKYRVVEPEDRSVYQIGETYGNPELIASYIGSGLLDAQFDFNLYDASVSAFAKQDGSFIELNRVLNQSLKAYGYHHLMGNISGNQDRTRFISYADGSVDFGEDPKLAGWTRKIEISDPIGYSRLAMLHAFNFTIPGIPVIYYGDEIGMPGANDPDNRRMMRFGKDLLPKEEELLRKVSKIANLRLEKMALLFGDLVTLKADDRTLVYLRNYFDETALVLFNGSDSKAKITLEIPAQYNVDKLKPTFGRKFSVSGRTLTIELPAQSFEILIN